jgi:Transposase DDE domain
MMAPESTLVQLLELVDRIPLPEAASSRRPGRPTFYSERLFLKALVVMAVRRLSKVHELLSALEEQTPEMAAVRQLLVHPVQADRFPSRRTFERRLGVLADELPAVIASLGRHLVALLAPWAHTGRAVALDSTVLTAYCGSVWHQKHRAQGIVPHSRIDTEAGWTHSGWHGWVYGWKLHVATTVAAVWLPLAARLTPANTGDNLVAPELIADLPPEVRFLLGDQQYNAENVRDVCVTPQRELVAPRRGPHPHTDAGAEVRRVFHELRSRAIENFNEHFKAIFDVHGPVPTKGLRNTQRFALGAIFVYQIAVLYRHEHQLTLNTGLKPFLRAA